MPSPRRVMYRCVLSELMAASQHVARHTRPARQAKQVQTGPDSVHTRSLARPQCVLLSSSCHCGASSPPPRSRLVPLDRESSIRNGARHSESARCPENFSHPACALQRRTGSVLRLHRSHDSLGASATPLARLARTRRPRALYV